MKTAPTLFLRGATHQAAEAFVGHAQAYATGAHGDQKRKYTGEDYVNHCIAVAEIVATVTDDAEIIAAALLHDTIEDTPATFTDLLLAFGPRVAQFVLEVTDASKPSDGNRAARKAIDRAHLARSSEAGATIKLADILNNTADIVAHDEGFAKVYLKEKSMLLPTLQHGDRTLYREAQAHIWGAIEKMEILGPSAAA